MGQKYCVNNNSHTSEPNEFVILINYWITGKNDRQTSEIAPALFNFINNILG